MCIKFKTVVDNDTQISDRFDSWEYGIVYLVSWPLRDNAQPMTADISLHIKHF